MNKKKKIISSTIITLFLFVCFFSYQQYIQKTFYDIGSETMLSTYEQIDNSFSLFTQRNWNLLSAWDTYLSSIDNANDAISSWKTLAYEKDSWDVSDFYLFNEDCYFITASNRDGQADSIQGAFKEMYEKQSPVISSYIASDSQRKIVFALPMSHPVKYKGITYTGIAVSYDISTIYTSINASNNTRNSDSFIIRKDGTIITSLENKTIIQNTIYNFFDFADKNFNYDFKINLENTITSNTEGSLKVEYNGNHYYLIYLNSDIENCKTIALVEIKSLNATLQNINTVSQVMITLVCISIFTTIIYLIYSIAHEKLSKNQNVLEKTILEKNQLFTEQVLSNQMIKGLITVIDRFAVVDLKNQTYEYHGHDGDSEYPEKGSYHDLLKVISKKYVVLNDANHLKLLDFLSKEKLQEYFILHKENFIIEYCERNENIFKVMNVIPIQYENNVVTKVMLVTQDIGIKHELENLANTDGLTGLFNERYFTSILHTKSSQPFPYTLFYLDLDHFKEVNDTYGHNFGDQLLKEVAKRLQQCTRAEDYVFRIGGDEFSIIFSNQSSITFADKMVERISETINKPYIFDDITLTVGTSCGYAIYPNDTNDEAKLRILADSRMYETKQRHHKNSAH